MASKYMSYGFGDPATWPPFSGNPNDPRAPEPPDDYDEEYDEEDSEEHDDDGE